MFLLTWEQVDALLMKVSFLWVDIHRPAEYLSYPPDFKLSLRFIFSLNSEEYLFESFKKLTSQLVEAALKTGQ